MDSVYKFKKTIKKRKVLFIDDNYNNITDAQKLTNITNFEIIHYTKNSNKHFNQSDIKIKDVFDKLINLVINNFLLNRL